MNNTLQFHFFEPETLKESKKNRGPKKREPNMFISFRNEMVKFKPYNIPMKIYSKQVSELWKGLSKDEKTKLQRIYQINRDQNLQNAVSEDEIGVGRIDEGSNAIATEDESSYNLSFYDKVRKDCYLTENPSESFFSNNDDINDIIKNNNHPGYN